MERKEAIEIIKKNYPDEGYTRLREALEYLIPELKESENERIKKQIVYAIKQLHICDETKNKCLAWLEKQGEQKSQRIVSAEAKEAMYDKPAWSEEDEKLYNDLSDTYFYNDEDYPQETYKQMLKRVLDWINKRAKSLRPQNQQESIEDRANNFFDALGDCGYMQDEILRFKSLWKQAGLLQLQNHWKPSKEQIKQLEWVAKQNKDNMIGKELMSLYQDLKKLKG